MSGHYRMDGTPYDDILEWAKDFEKRVDRILAQETLPNGRWVSTVWIGTDYNFAGQGPPLIFESMVFPKKGEYNELDCLRYATKEEALAGHKELCAKWAENDGEA